MSRFNLRRMPRISYFEPEEPNFDEYIFCDKCVDYVYEYCAIHGPLLVIPDDKVPAKTGLPSYVPRAALTIPHVFLHIAPSIIPGAGLGIFSTLTLPRGVRFGPYRGVKTTEVNSSYCWQLYDRNNKPCHVVDAEDANKSNWMRYVNCARHCSEQNLVAYQYQGQLYYRTIKIIPRFTELMVFYGSEFAHFLKIDLRRYNSPAALLEIIDAPLPKKPKLDTVDKKSEQHDVPKETRKVADPKELTKNEHHGNMVGSDSQPNVQTNTNPDKKLKKINKPIETDKNNNKMSNNVFKCNDCYKQYDTKSDLVEHIQSHEKIKRDIYLKCKQCSYTDITQDTLQRHINNVHCNKDKKHECHINTHLLTHTGQKNYSCSVCKFNCRHKSALQRHLRIHTGEKPYSCPMCNFKCNRKHHLKNHLRIHTGEKPYSCSICNFKCNRKCSLKNHLRIHTGEKPYYCSICNFKCNLKGNLKRHLRIHTGEKPYSCSMCNFKCNQKGSLKTHLKIHFK